MAARIVLMGYAGHCLEVDSQEAGALITSGLCRVSLTRWGGPLSDATVLHFRPEYLAAHGGESGEGQESAWRRACWLVRDAKRREFKVENPVPVGAES